MWYVGVILSIIGSGLSNYGLNIQKYSFIKQQQLEPKFRKKYYKDCTWWVGISLVVIGAIGDFAALTFAPQSVIMPVGAFTLVCNVFIAHRWLKESITKRDVVGTVKIVLGAILVAAFGSKEEQQYTLDELVELYQRWSMLAYALFILGAILFFRTIVLRAERLLLSKGPNSPEYKRILKLHPLSYAGLAGTFGAQSVMFAKSTAELLKQSIKAENEFDQPLSWVLVLSMITTVFLQTHYLAMGLKHFDALYIVPVFQCFFITLSVLGGAVYFKELQEFTVLQWIMFPVGVAVIVIGVVFMSCREMHSAEASDTLPAGAYKDLVTPDVRSQEDLQLDHLFDPMIDPVYTPADTEEEIFARRSSAGFTVLGSIPSVPFRRSAAVHRESVKWSPTEKELRML